MREGLKVSIQRRTFTRREENVWGAKQTTCTASRQARGGDKKGDTKQMTLAATKHAVRGAQHMQ
jgi:hypothetical protein